jgi:predicted RNA-binding Zn-ribbon protein involved in translation (DUF1610 family)
MTLLIDKLAGINNHECPECGTDKIGRAHRVGARDNLLSAINIYPYRCRIYGCKARFYRTGRGE